MIFAFCISIIAFSQASSQGLDNINIHQHSFHDKRGFTMAINISQHSSHDEPGFTMAPRYEPLSQGPIFPSCISLTKTLILFLFFLFFVCPGYLLCLPLFLPLLLFPTTTATATLRIASTTRRSRVTLCPECSFKHSRVDCILEPLEELFLVESPIHVYTTWGLTTPLCWGTPLATTLLCHAGIDMKGCLVSVRRASHSLEKTEIQISKHVLLCLLWCSTKEKLLSANKAEPEFLHLCMYL